MTMERDDDDFGEGYIAESHPLRPTTLTVPGRDDSKGASISSSVTDLDAPIYARDTTLPISPKAVSSLILFRNLYRKIAVN